MAGSDHSPPWKVAYGAFHAAPSAHTPKAGASVEEGSGPSSSSWSSVAWLWVCLALQQAHHLLAPCPLGLLRGWWLSCLFWRDRWHWISLSNLAPCLHCDEWGSADDKQRSLGRRSKAPPGLPGAYLWLCCFGKFPPWECGVCGEWTSPPLDTSTQSQWEKRDLCGGYTKAIRDNLFGIFCVWCSL